MSEEAGIKKEEPKKPCRICGDPCGAMRCKGCGAYQEGWRKRWPLPPTVGMLTPTAALLGAIVTFWPFACTQCSNFWHRHSETQIGFAGADQNMVYAQVWNTGRKETSSVLKYTLRLKNIDLQDVPLVPVRDATHDVHSAIPAGGDYTIALYVLGVAPQPPKTSADIRDALYQQDQKKVWIDAEVIESAEPEKLAVRSSKEFDAMFLRTLILNKLP